MRLHLRECREDPVQNKQRIDGHCVVFGMQQVLEAPQEPAVPFPHHLAELFVVNIFTLCQESRMPVDSILVSAFFFVPIRQSAKIFGQEPAVTTGLIRSQRRKNQTNIIQDRVVE